MSDLAKSSQHVIMDFVCPTRQLREIVTANVNIFMNTIVEGHFEDTNMLFEMIARKSVIQFKKKMLTRRPKRIVNDLMTADNR